MDSLKYLPVSFLLLVAISLVQSSCERFDSDGPDIRIKLPDGPEFDTRAASPVMVIVSDEHLEKCNIKLAKNGIERFDTTITTQGDEIVFVLPNEVLLAQREPSEFQLTVVAFNSGTFNKKSRSFTAFEGYEKLNYHLVWGLNNVTVFDADFNTISERFYNTPIDELHALDQYEMMVMRSGNIVQGWSINDQKNQWSFDFPVYDINKIVTLNGQVHISGMSNPKNPSNGGKQLITLDRDGTNYRTGSSNFLLNNAVVNPEQGYCIHSTGYFPIYVTWLHNHALVAVYHSHIINHVAVNNLNEVYAIAQDKANYFIAQADLNDGSVQTLGYPNSQISKVKDIVASSANVVVLETDNLVIYEIEGNIITKMPTEEMDGIYCSFYDDIIYLWKGDVIYTLNPDKREVTPFKSFSYNIKGFETEHIR